MTVNLVFFLVALRIIDLVSYQNDLQKYYSGSITNADIRYSPPIDGVQIFVVIVTIVVCSILEFTVGILFLWHLYYIAQNITTIEDHENNTIEGLKKRDIVPKTSTYPYDLGVYKNFCQVFGGNWYVWFIPGVPSLGTGFAFPKTDPETIWPPKEYYLHKKYPYGKPTKQDKVHGKRVPRVRRGSEGYIIPNITAEDREAMVTGTYYAESAETISASPMNESGDVSSTDYDSLEDDFEEDEREGMPQVPATDDSSDNELLGERKKKL